MKLPETITRQVIKRNPRGIGGEESHGTPGGDIEKDTSEMWDVIHEEREMENIATNLKQWHSLVDAESPNGQTGIIIIPDLQID